MGISWVRECRICDLLTSDFKTGDPIFTPILHINFNFDNSVNSFIPELAIWILKDWFTCEVPGVKQHREMKTFNFLKS